MYRRSENSRRGETAPPIVIPPKSPMKLDPIWENINAPQFVDFLRINENVDDGDSFFDRLESIQPSPEKVKGRKYRSGFPSNHQKPPSAPCSSKSIKRISAPPMKSTTTSRERSNLVKSAEGMVKKEVSKDLPPPVKMNGQAAAAVSRRPLVTDNSVNRQPPIVVGEKGPMKVLSKPPVGPPKVAPRARSPSPTTGVRKCKPKSPTKTHAFVFETEMRSRSRSRECLAKSGQTSAYGSLTSVNTAVKSSSGHSARSHHCVQIVRAVSHNDALNNAAGDGTSRIPRRTLSADRVDVKKVEVVSVSKSRPAPILAIRKAPVPKIRQNPVLVPPVFKARPMPAAQSRGRPLIATRTQPVGVVKVATQDKKEAVVKKTQPPVLHRMEPFRAKPAPIFSKPTIPVNLGKKRPTTPISPKFMTDQRAKQRTTRPASGEK